MYLLLREMQKHQKVGRTMPSMVRKNDKLKAIADRLLDKPKKVRKPKKKK
jgi:hypothetical protein